MYMVFFGPSDKKGCVVLPKSATPSRIDANLSGFLDALGKLDDSDVEKLDGVAANGKQKRFIMPPWGKSSSLLSSVRLSYTTIFTAGARVQLGLDNWVRKE